MFKTIIISAALLLSAAPAFAFPAIVSSVHDGDTATILTQTGKTHCRLGGIDAPEMAWHGKWTDQPYAYEAHAALENMIMGQTVDVQDTGQRSYERMVCKITATIDGKPVDVQEAMVRDGDAWSATQFEPELDRDPAMPGLEAQARAAHRAFGQRLQRLHGIGVTGVRDEHYSRQSS